MAHKTKHVKSYESTIKPKQRLTIINVNDVAFAFSKIEIFNFFLRKILKGALG
jgi:hypothetical protein